MHQQHSQSLSPSDDGFSNASAISLSIKAINPGRHRSSKDIRDKITIDTPPLILLDRLTRLGVNRLFTARSSQQFHLELTDAVVDSKVKDLNGKRIQEHTLPKRAVIGIGAGAHYTLYDVGSDQTHFLTVGDVTKSRGRGFA